MSGSLTVDEDGKKTRYEFRGKAVVGRDGDCQIVLRSRSVSRKHAELVDSPGGWLLRDLSSGNGTFAGRERVGEVTLVDGETVRFGDVPAVFQEVVSEEEKLSRTGRIVAQTLAIKPPTKARPVAVVIAFGSVLALLLLATVYERRCGRPGPTSQAPRPAASRTVPSPG
jgi:pSer/pThr/pTyr-binding forkhead associated (FHA) protein